MEAAVDVRRYAILALHARNDDDDDIMTQVIARVHECRAALKKDEELLLQPVPLQHFCTKIL